MELVPFHDLFDDAASSSEGRDVTQAVSRLFPTAAARFRFRAGMWGLWWTKRQWGRFSSSTSVSPTNHYSTNFSIIIITRYWHNRPLVAAVPSGPNWTPLHIIPIKKSSSEYAVLITTREF
jgi:hypothetical protein